MKYAFALLLLFAIAVPGLSSPKVASACSCIQRTPEEILNEADAVFYGKAINVEPGESSVVADISVEKVWKGEVTKTTTVRTGRDSAGCGIDIVKDESALFVANTSEEGELFVGLCNSLGTDVDVVESYLGESESPAANPPSSPDYLTPLFAILIGAIFGFGTGEVLRRMRKLRK